MFSPILALTEAEPLATNENAGKKKCKGKATAAHGKRQKRKASPTAQAAIEAMDGLTRFAFNTVVKWNKPTVRGKFFLQIHSLSWMFVRGRLVSALKISDETIDQSIVCTKGSYAQQTRSISASFFQSRKALHHIMTIRTQNFAKLSWNHFYISYLHTPAIYAYAHRHKRKNTSGPIKRCRQDWQTFYGHMVCICKYLNDLICKKDKLLTASSKQKNKMTR
ncbi:hypothetical protein G9A89_008940, partial [Geosiphon pyriformis]